MSAQLEIDWSAVAECRSAGQVAMQACTDKAERSDPLFREKATAAILAHLQAVGQCTGEVLTDIAKAHGARPADDRAFGSVFLSLIRKRRIFIVGYAPRLKGHGCMGAKLYALQH